MSDQTKSWIYMEHPAFADSGTRFPNQEGVLETYEARGWVEVPDPETGDAQVFVPPKLVEKNERDGWVTLYHPETGASHDFPSHPDAVQGAYESGWQATPPKTPEPDPVPPVDDSDDGSAKKRTRKTKPPTEDPADGADPAIDDEEEVTRG